MVVVRREDLTQTIDRLERYVARLERRYEMSSAEMREAVKSGRFKETAEIGSWLSKYRQLEEFRGRQRSGRTTGTHTRAT
jgi:hypothetical protein